MHPEERGANWLASDAAGMVRLGHGTYWETAANIVATGEFSPSDDKTDWGAREYHGTRGVYLTDDFTAYGEHYAWPTNVFGNNCFYGICFQVLADPRFMLKAWRVRT